MFKIKHSILFEGKEKKNPFIFIILFGYYIKSIQKPTYQVHKKWLLKVLALKIAILFIIYIYIYIMCFTKLDYWYAT
jgi:hypothetical protein